MSTIPKWYVREDTLAGPLYFYPRPAVTERVEHSWDRPKEYSWSSQDGEVDERGAYLVTRQPVREFMASWERRPEIDHYALKPRGALRGVAEAIVNSGIYLERLTPDQWRDRCESDGERRCGECTWCASSVELYAAIRAEPVQASEVFDVTHLVELATTPDPHPDYTWTLDSPPLAAMYPARAAHQFPGYTTGLFEATADAAKVAMAELGLPEATVNAFNHGQEVSVTCKIPWDEPRSWKPFKGGSQKVREMNRERRSKALYGVSWRESIKIHDRVGGQTKEEAVAKLHERVKEHLRKLIPPHVKACGQCSGRGYVE